MSFSDHKITQFTHRISELADQPNLPADELKARFDSSPEELRQGLNAVCDDAQTLSNKVDNIITQTFEGVVDKVSINGTTTNGFTNYPVTIIIEDYGDLKPGMNVSAEIIGEEIPNALCIPVDAVERGNTVTVPGPGALSEDGLSVVDVTKLETKEVTLGRSDDEYVEVTGGLEAGDVVLIRNQASTLMDMMMGG